MAKTASPTPKRKPAPSTASPIQSRSRSRKDPVLQPAPTGEPLAADMLTLLTRRLDTLEEKITVELSALTKELQSLRSTPTANQSDGVSSSETFLPIVADLIRRSLVEHLTPVIATLRRLEERIGFISNRLKPPSGGQERHKPWRRDSPHHLRSRGHPRSGQSWSPPSAASVQGHFAPRPLPGGGEETTLEEEE